MRALDGKTRSLFNEWVGMLGEQYVDRQTGDINNVGPKLIGIFELVPGVKVAPDSIDQSFEPPTIGDVKVGLYSDYDQAEELATLVEKGWATPGMIYFLESPITGEVGAKRGISSLLKLAGFDFVYFRGPWWELFQVPKGYG